MKKLFVLFILVAAACTTNAQTPQQKKPQEKKAEAKTYVCPMHADVVSDKPGKCSKCGMNLVEKKTNKKE